MLKPMRAALLLLVLPALADPLPPDAAAVVNGETVPMAELHKTLMKRHGQAVLQELVLRKLIDQEALRAGVTVSEREVQRRYAEALDELKKQFAAEVSLAAMLQAQGVAEAEFHDQVVVRLTLEKLVIRDLLCGAWARPRALFSSTEEKARAMLDKLKAGEDFCALAKAESVDPGSAAREGDLGIRFRGELPAELEEPAFSLPVGTLSGVIRTPMGFGILKIEARQEARPRPYPEIRGEVETRLEKDPPSQDDLERFLGRLRRAATLQTHPDLPAFPVGAAPRPAP
jgi:parvulin-like peptidyl-prolyl isomerase